MVYSKFFVLLEFIITFFTFTIFISYNNYNNSQFHFTCAITQADPKWLVPITITDSL